ncbi:MAG: thioredoxin domain-containing protein [Chloroflexi bacterium]|jgi:uncharacterized protein|nr:thioredoxin domain-containing protein [Chloroflexota bacterium]MBT7080601.1 thioredoxin domain-containing protein [Chloroflexota bacterium]MBT7290355.1 thioredoxin domain-containing protein [Chloroflexota bacterium]
MSEHKHSNRLINETSPYLLQHAHNPVDWYAWGDEALTRAKAEDKPILLSIGYSACHWCHVMEHESFENDSIARLMNENYINIKVDREERPDLDAIYMEAVQLMGGSGGWPLNVFLNSDREPFYGGTYFPPQDRQGLPGFERVLTTVADAYKNKKSQVQGTVDQVVGYLNRATESISDSVNISTNTLTNAYVSLKNAFDTRNGGFGMAPKFPQPMALEFLLRYWHRTADIQALAMVENSLSKMAEGGIYDQIGGGFHRYSVDAKWLVPHFEKMLYDNALLSGIYIHAYQATGNELYKRIACETLDWVVREMTDSNGGFYSTQDADSEGVEGKYYVWSSDEIIEVLGDDDGALFSKHFGVTGYGNFEGQNILNVVTSADSLALEFNIESAEVIDRIERSKRKLLEPRSQRIAPHRDEKILASWNGLMLASFAEGAMAFGRQDYLEIATNNARFLTKAMYKDGRLSHSFKDERSSAQGFLQDYAFLVDGLIRLYQASFDEHWLSMAIKLAGEMVARFWDESGKSFFDTDEGQYDLLVRPKNMYDNAVPSGASMAVYVLLYLSRFTDNSDYEAIAVAAIKQLLKDIAHYPLGFGYWLCDVDFYLSQRKEIVLAGKCDDVRTKGFVDIISKHYMPNMVQASVDPANTSLEIALLKDREMIGDMPTVYICENFTCKRPVTDSAELESMLA